MYYPSINDQPTLPPLSAREAQSLEELEHEAPNSDVTVQRTSPSLAALLSLTGALLILFAFTRPIFENQFVAEKLAPSLMPYHAGVMDAAVAGESASSSAQTRLTGFERSTGNIAQIDAATAVMSRFDHSHGEMTLTQFASFLIDIDSLPIANSSDSVRACRTLLALMAVVALFAILVALYTIALRFKPLDTYQIAAQGTFGTLSIALFGAMAVLTIVDASVGSQLVSEGIFFGAAGSVLVWTSALGSLGWTKLIPVGFSSFVMVGIVASLSVLLVTL